MHNRLVVITGSSRGIGAAIALEANRHFKEKTIFLLIARDHSKLLEVKEEINWKIFNDSPIDPESKNKIVTLKYDFSKAAKTSELLNILQISLKDEKLNEINELFVFYNHGTLLLNSVEKIADDFSEQFQTNVGSVWTLLSAMMSIFPLSLVSTQYHINISSLLASKPMPQFSVYNSTRAARVKIFECLALENPTMRVLNYQPGPVYTGDYEDGKLVKAADTCKKLFEIIQKNTFANGSSVDYYDNNI